MTNLLSIAFVVLQLDQVKVQMEPSPGYPWITNQYGTNLVIPAGCPIVHEAHVGPTIKLDWTPATNVVLQWSADLIDWRDVRVRFVGSSGWMAYPAETRFYRLRI